MKIIITDDNIIVTIKNRIRTYSYISDEFKVIKECFNSKKMLTISEKEFLHVVNKHRRKNIKDNLIKDMQIDKQLLEKLNDTTN